MIVLSLDPEQDAMQLVSIPGDTRTAIAWDDGKYNFIEGPTDLEGDKSMCFVRMRKKDPDGDFGWTKRQRKVIQGIVDKGVSVICQ